MLTDAIDSRVLPDTYVRDGAPVVIESVSGAAIRPPATTTSRCRWPPPTCVRRCWPRCWPAHRRDPTAGDDKGNVSDEEISPPTSVLSAVLSGRGWPGLPVLHRIISTPVLRPDGTLLQTEGYDTATGFYLGTPTPMVPIPARPDPAAVAASRQFLLQRFLRDFPWRSDADRANYLALLVSPILRPYTRSLSPFGVIDATMPARGRPS